MSLVINNNLMAVNVTRNLNSSYGKLATSTRRLSSGLRVGTAADDAAGLAMRELMRADIKTLAQGLRNANDGISMIQTADGALGVIDAKLIRMKELAEQAATGTYTDAQRLMINQEYQLMAKEITRMAMDTDFNSRKLLAGTGQEIHVEKSEGDATDVGAVKLDEDGNTESWGNEYTSKTTELTGAGLADFGAQTTDPDTHIISFADPGADQDNKVLKFSNDNTFFDIDYDLDQKNGVTASFDLKTGATTGFVNIEAQIGASNIPGTDVKIEKRTGAADWVDITTDTVGGPQTTTDGDDVRITYTDSEGVTHRTTLENFSKDITFSYTAGTKTFAMVSANPSTTSPTVTNEITVSKKFNQITKTGVNVQNDAETFWEKVPFEGTTKVGFTHDAKTGEIKKAQSVESSASSSYGSLKTPVQDYTIEAYNETTNTWDKLSLGTTTGATLDIPDTVKKFRITAEYGDYNKVRDTFSNNTGGKFTVTKTQYGMDLGMTTTNPSNSSTQLNVKSEDLVVVNVHFGSGSQKVDSYDTYINMASAKSLGVGEEAGDHIKTQKMAKKALDNLNIAITRKDEIRAEIGSTQNRLAATVENVSIQKENLQASESRISDVDVASEMTQFNKVQIMTNAAVSMLAQANSLPKAAQKLIDGR